MTGKDARQAVDPAIVTQRVLSSRKHEQIASELVSAIALAESSKEKRVDDAVKRVKRKLHQVVGAYIDQAMPFEAWIAGLSDAQNDAERSALCRKILSHHSSTRERLSEMSDIYRAIFDGISAPRRVLDLACGLNPVGRFLMPLPSSTEYIASDVHVGLVGFLNAYMQKGGYRGSAEICDLLGRPMLPEVDIVLLLKALPCLEQVSPDAGDRVLAALAAPVVVVSFPTASLSGRRVGMPSFYRSRFLSLVPQDTFEVDEFEFKSELIFRLRRRNDPIGRTGAYGRG